MNDTPANRLHEVPAAFDFFQAVRLLERLGGRPVGGDASPAAEAVRFAAPASVAFAAAAVESLTPGSDGAPPVMAVNFLGFSGPSAVLPSQYTRAVIEGDRSNRDESGALAAWLNMFTHRWTSLFFRAWAKYRLPERFAAADRVGSTDAITATVFSFAGLGTAGLRQRLDGVADLAVLRYAGMLARSARPAIGLERMLSDYFRERVRVVQFHGRWLPLEEAEQTRLGKRLRANDKVGTDLVVGRRVWDVASAVRIEVGPLDGGAFAEWLPDRSRLTALGELTRLYLRDGLDFDVQLILKAADVPPLRLTKPGPRLGWATWLTSRPPERDATDAVFGG